MDRTWNIIRILKALHCSWVDFMTHTSSPGLKYICDNGRKRSEKIFWIMVIVSGIISTFFMVKIIYKRYRSDPIMSNIESTHYPMWLFPFPGVTICNNNRILKSKAEAIVNQLVLPENTDSDEILEDLKYLWELNDAEFGANERFQRLQQILDVNRYSISELMLKLGQNCDELFEKCSWENQIVNCSDLFEIRKTNHGFCCSFNHFGVKDSRRDSTHGKRPWKVEGKPRHTIFYGRTWGLSLLINPMLHEYFVTDSSSNGISVMIHDPGDYPDGTTQKRISVGKEVLMPITVTAMHCSKEIRKLSMSIRRCLFHDEKPLYFFSEYTYKNCMAECVMNYTIKHCGCVPYYYPDNGALRTCNLSHVNCLHEHYERIHRRKPIRSDEELLENHDNYSPDFEDMNNVTKCECHSQCEEICYRVEMTYGDFKGTPWFLDTFFNEDTNVTDRILLHVYLQSSFGQLIKRDVIHTLTDLISRLGGVVCLFLGCSFITLVEILYFFTIRIWTPKCQKEKNMNPNDFLSPTAIRDARFPPVRRQRHRTIYVQAQNET